LLASVLIVENEYGLEDLAFLVSSAGDASKAVAILMSSEGSFTVRTMTTTWRLPKEVVIGRFIIGGLIPPLSLLVVLIEIHFL
jgi:hypothetical protein